VCCRRLLTLFAPPPALAARRLWTPTSARPGAARLAASQDGNAPLLSLSSSAASPVVARRGEEGPNPMVMERFQSVISSLFAQARACAACKPPAGDALAKPQRAARAHPKTLFFAAC
jgi:hypothetical protein